MGVLFGGSLFAAHSSGQDVRPIITVSLTVVGTIETFDQAAFKALAATLGNGIVPADITLTLTEGSVVVDASIRAPR